ncbi:MAG: hypothetical protein FWD68_16655 [Alphaproteobacteria bacterium]|nr:hypothetical protein [Alphaproteobacteria bacterium]
MRNHPMSADQPANRSATMRGWILPVFMATVAAIFLNAACSKNKHIIGNALCRNFRDIWLEKSGGIECYRAP